MSTVEDDSGKAFNCSGRGTDDMVPLTIEPSSVLYKIEVPGGYGPTPFEMWELSYRPKNISPSYFKLKAVAAELPESILQSPDT